MTRRHAALALAALLVLAGCSGADAVANGVATDDGIAAIALPEEQYREMLKRATLSTQSGPMYLAALGLDDGCDELDSAVDMVVAQNLPRWRANLIAAYRDTVPPDQLAEAVQMSPRRGRSALQQHLPGIAASMRSASEPLLKESTAEVIESLSAAAAKVDAGSIDVQARQRDLASMKASRQICGVG